MSAHVVVLEPRDSIITGPDGLLEAVTSSLRAPDRIVYLDGTVRYEFDIDLAAEEAALFDRVVAYVRGSVTLTVAEREALVPSLDTLRTFQKMSRAEWIALTDAERERGTFDVLTALVRVDRALLRE